MSSAFAQIDLNAETGESIEATRVIKRYAQGKDCKSAEQSLVKKVKTLNSEVTDLGLDIQRVVFGTCIAYSDSSASASAVIHYSFKAGVQITR